MNIIYDISLLGVGHCFSYARTGIFRYTESLANTLASLHPGGLRFFTSATTRHQVQAYLQTATLQNHNIPLEVPSHGVFGTVFQQVSGAFGLPGPKILGKAVGLGILLELATSARYGQTASQGDIFHSMFYPLPRHWPKQANTQRFITVYDIGALLLPDLFEFDKPPLLRAIINSIQPDDRVITISRYTQTTLCNHIKTLDPERVFVVPGAASELFYPCTDSRQVSQVQKKYGIPPDTPYILSLCTLEKRKNLGILVEAFSRLVRQEKLPDLHLVLAGEAGMAASRTLAPLADASPIRRRIITTGYVADRDLSPLYSGALMFAYPSRFEGFGLPPLEAMQCGVPVIAANTTSLPEVVGDAGFLANPDDVDSWCQRMLEIYRDSRLRETLSQKSLARAKTFSWEKSAQLTLQAYQSGLQTGCAQTDFIDTNASGQLQSR